MVEDRTHFLKGLMDVLPEGVVLLDANGDISNVNGAVIDLLGYNSIYLVGKNLAEFTPSFLKTEVTGILEELGTFDIIKDRRIRLYDVKGQLRDLNISLSLLRSNKAEPIGIFCVLKDIGDVTTMEKELEKAQMFSQNILDSAGVGIVATDLKGGIVFASRRACDMFKDSLENLKGENVIKKLPEPVYANEKFKELVEKGAGFEYGSEIVVDGTTHSFWYIWTQLRDEKDQPIGSTVTLNDVSKLKDIESQLKKTNTMLKGYTTDLENLVKTTQALGSTLDEEKIYQTMVSAAKDTLEVGASCFFKQRVDNKNFKVTCSEGIKIELTEDISNKEFISLLSELKSPRIIHNTSKEFIPKDFLELGFKSAIFAPIYGKDTFYGVLGVFYGKVRLVKKKDVELLESVGSGGALALENSSLYRELKKFASELEEKVKERTAELLHANEELAQSNRLKDLFIDIMRHDLLNPAMIMRNLIELAMTRDIDEEMTEALEKVHRASDKILGLIENASLLAKLEAEERIELRKMDLHTIAKEVIEELKHLADEKGMKISLNSESGCAAMTNPLINDVFSNLIGNAIKYAPGNSDIEVCIEEVGPSWRISVVDRGSGIPNEHKEAIFTRFKRVEKGAVKGSGLGLAIVKKIVEAHMGKVWVEDAPTGGSLFIFEIPKTRSILQL